MGDKVKDVGARSSSIAAPLRRRDPVTGRFLDCKPVLNHGRGPYAPINSPGPQGAPHQQQVFPDLRVIVPIKMHSNPPVDQASGKLTEPVLVKPSKCTVVVNAPLVVRSLHSAGGKLIEQTIERVVRAETEEGTAPLIVRKLDGAGGKVKPTILKHVVRAEPYKGTVVTAPLIVRRLDGAVGKKIEPAIDKVVRAEPKNGTAPLIVGRLDGAGGKVNEPSIIKVVIRSELDKGQIGIARFCIRDGVLTRLADGDHKTLNTTVEKQKEKIISTAVGQSTEKDGEKQKGGAEEASNRKRSFEIGPGKSEARMIHMSEMKSNAVACEKKAKEDRQVEALRRRQLVIENDILKAQNKKLKKYENLYLELKIQVEVDAKESSEELDRAKNSLKRKKEDVKKLMKKNEDKREQVVEYQQKLDTCEKELQKCRKLCNDTKYEMEKKDDILRKYYRALQEVSIQVAEGKGAEILLQHKKSGREKDVHNYLDVSVPVGFVAKAIECSRRRRSSYVAFVKQLCINTFKLDAIHYFSVKGIRVRRSVFKTITLPSRIRKGFIGLAAHIGEQHKLVFPADGKPISNSQEDEHEMRVILARRTLDDWLTSTGEKYLSDMLEKMDDSDEDYSSS